ncbi:hypothetical protein Clacol_001941 [Clathrus columnatus]|uniref:C3H1-type domain-containing protein n=1 Tax=Clathrus columnatus TaxID=1419009 RepID=A0AAV5A3Y4_9AGAM|nr:hypothetical protein Clacol_001941 [Clathrus columnatus]
MAAVALEIPPGLAGTNRQLNAELAEWQTTIHKYQSSSSIIDAERDIFRRLCESYKNLEDKLSEAQETNEVLRKEVELWKREYNKETRKVDKAEDRIKLLEAQCSNVLSKDRESMVLVLIDGDGYIFNDELLQRGREGGLEAAQMLNESIINHINVSSSQPSSPKSDRSRSATPTPGQVQVWTYMFFNLKGLKQAVVGANICTVEEFEGFMIGFNQANPRLVINDVHSGKEAADAKVKAYLQSWTQFPQTSRIYFGGAHDNGYYPTLAELHNNNLLDRLVLLQGYEQTAHEIASLRLPVLNIDGLFRSEKIPTTKMLTINLNGAQSARPSTPSPPSTTSSSSNGKGMPVLYAAAVESYHPTSAAQLMARPDSPCGRRLKRINPNLELHKHVPPPCNLFYLSKCVKGADCKYAHDYLLEAEHYEMLSQNAKKSPCPAVNSGKFSVSIWRELCPWA